MGKKNYELALLKKHVQIELSNIDGSLKKLMNDKCFKAGHSDECDFYLRLLGENNALAKILMFIESIEKKD